MEARSRRTRRRDLALSYLTGSVAGAEEFVDVSATDAAVAAEAQIVEAVAAADAGMVEGSLELDGEAPLRLHSTGWRGAKRSVDVVLSLLLIVLTLPLMLAIILAVLLESGGPVFFVHRRLGKDGSDFGLIKFRTMVKDAEAKLEAHLEANPHHLAEWNERFKLRKDPRITRVGRVLRASSLDELPQLFNILKGDMSLVGPRAIVRDEVVRFGDFAPTLLSVKPGLTGLWGVSGRSEVMQDERALLEYRYVTEWSLLLDLWILVRTIPAVLRGHGAF